MRSNIDMIVDLTLSKARLRAIESIRDAQANEQEQRGLIPHNSTTDAKTLNKEQHDKND